MKAIEDKEPRPSYTEIALAPSLYFRESEEVVAKWIIDFRNTKSQHESELMMSNEEYRRKFTNKEK